MKQINKTKDAEEWLHELSFSLRQNTSAKYVRRKKVKKIKNYKMKQQTINELGNGNQTEEKPKRSQCERKRY